MSETGRCNSRRVNRGKRRLEVVESLKELAAVEGPDLNLKRFTEVIGRLDRYVPMYVGAFCNLREAGGRPRKRQIGYSAEYLTERLLEAEQSIKGPVSKRRFLAITSLSPSCCDREFGSGFAFRWAAGLSAHFTFRDR